MNRFLKYLAFITSFLLCYQSAFATIFTDVREFHCDGIIGEGPFASLFYGEEFSYYHDMPYDFEVPFSKVNSASLTINAYWVNDNNDVVEVNGVSQGTLTPGGSFIPSWDWRDSKPKKCKDNPSISFFDITSVFSGWSKGDMMEVTVSAEGDLFDGKLLLSSSKLTLDYSDTPEPSTMVLLALGLFLMTIFMRKRVGN